MLTTFPPSYLYQQYVDDPDLQALVAAYNQLAQTYIDAANTLNLPIYTSDPVSGNLLDWVGMGIYGIDRPSLSVSPVTEFFLGVYNSFPYNTQAFNAFTNLNPFVQTPVDDDVYRRCMTWQIYKGDGKYFNIRWLKRRIMRFLFGINGIDPGISETYPISVTFAGLHTVIIRFLSGTREISGGSLFNLSGFNQVPFNSIISNFVPNPFFSDNDAELLKEAIQTGVLPLPFQYEFIVQTS